nr:hypothetical protein MarFTME_460 [Marseillevirus futianmevirus]
MNIDANSLLNLILNSAVQQLNLNRDNAEKQQTNNSSSSTQPNLMDLFEPTPSPPIVSMKQKRQLMALGGILLRLQERGYLPCLINSEICSQWPEEDQGSFSDFSDKILENMGAILGEETRSLEYMDAVLEGL